MPNYKALTIKAECAILDNKVKLLKEVDAKLQTKDIASGPKASLEKQHGTLAAEAGQAIDKVLAACDVAEQNNRVYCQYIADGHKAAKVEMDKLEPLLKRLETAWDDKVGLILTRTVGQIEQAALSLKEDDEKLRAVNMVDEYRGNGWKNSVKAALAYAPDRTADFAAREKNRLDGIQLSTGVVAQKTRLKEYVVRAQALQKTASARLSEAMGEEKNYAKIREEMIDFANGVEKDVKEYNGQLAATAGRVKDIMKAAMGVKTPTKDTYKPVLLMEPKLDSLLKEVKGKAKTMRIQYGEEAKKVQVKGMADRYFKPQLAKADAAIKALDKEIADFVKVCEPFRHLIEIGKKAK